MENKKKINDLSKIFTLKFENLNLFAKLDIIEPPKEKDTVSGNIYLKNKDNRIIIFFDYRDNNLIIKKGRELGHEIIEHDHTSSIVDFLSSYDLVINSN